MITSAATALEAGPGAPQVWMLDARAAGFDEPGLRSWARQLPEAAHVAHSSRSYRHPYALVACGGAPVGVDIERVEPFGQEFLDSICKPGEHQRLLGRDDAAIAGAWCSKEALSKALGDAGAYDPRHLASPMFWPNGCSGPWRATSLPVPTGYVGWLCWRATRTERARSRGRRRSLSPAIERPSSRWLLSVAAYALERESAAFATAQSSTAPMG